MKLTSPERLSLALSLLFALLLLIASVLTFPSSGDVARDEATRGNVEMWPY